MAKRSFAGYLCDEKLAEGIFGETWNAVNKRGTAVRIVVLDSQLSANEEFAAGLARFSVGLSGLSHENVISTRTVGRGKDGSLIAICSPIRGAFSLSEALNAGREIPEAVSFAIGLGVLRGLIYAHEQEVIHGGIHPQSIWIDAMGNSVLGDLGLARALCTAAVSPDNAQLLAGLRGYLAPEITLGNPPEMESDIFASSVLFCKLLWGQGTPPKTARPRLAELFRKAQHSKPSERGGSAAAFLESLEEILVSEKVGVADNSRVLAFFSESDKSSSELRLPSPGEELMDLCDQTQVSEQMGLSLEAALGEDDEITNIHSFSDDDAPSFSEDEAPTREVVKLSDSVLAALDMEPVDIESEEMPTLAEGFAEEETTVDSLVSTAITLPLDVIEKDDDDEGGASTEVVRIPVADDYVDNDETPLPAPRPFHADGSHQDELVEQIGRHAASNSPFDDVDDLPDAQPTGFKSLRLIAMIVFAMAVLFAIAYTITDFLKAAENEKKSEEAELAEELLSRQPKPGTVVITSETADAAVWLLIGRTPTVTFPLSSSMIHELRFDREGFASRFGSVVGKHWSGEEKERKANFSTSLESLSGSVEPREELLAFPKALEVPGVVSGPGQGPVHVTSDPEGAEVWLLVGTTPRAELRGIAAGQDYEFKIRKDGYRPVVAVVKEAEWYLSGREGPVRPSLTRNVVLQIKGAKEDQAKDKGKTKRTPKRGSEGQ